MNLFFKPSVDIIHPETGRLLVSVGTNYPMEELTRLSEEYGFDFIPGVLILADGETPYTIAQRAGL